MAGFSISFQFDQRIALVPHWSPTEEPSVAVDGFNALLLLTSSGGRRLSSFLKPIRVPHKCRPEIVRSRNIPESREEKKEVNVSRVPIVSFGVCFVGCTQRLARSCYTLFLPLLMTL
jgi:hypothetical protein